MQKCWRSGGAPAMGDNQVVKSARKGVPRAIASAQLQVRVF